MSERPFIIRPLHDREEIAAFIRVADQAFNPTGDPEVAVTETEEYLANNPATEKVEIWAAFDPEDQRLLGGYWLEHRQFCIDSIRLRTGCIGAVAVSEAERKRGVAAAMMADAVNNAAGSATPLLLLNGISDFYYRFGYVPVVEENKVTFERERIRTLPPQEDILLQQATTADAESVLNLYAQHLHLPIGHFERSVAEQAFRIKGADDDSVYLLARNAQGEATGYLLMAESKTRFRQTEVVATDWSTLSALLQAYEKRLTAHEEATIKSETGEPGAPDAQSALSEISWNLPPNSPIAYELVERIPFRSERRHHYNADWMARAGNLDLLIQKLCPLWTERLATRKWGSSGVLNLSIDKRCFPLLIAEHGVQIDAEGVRGDADSGPILGEVQLTQPALMQLCFGFRPAAWIAGRPGQTIPENVLPLVESLFPQRPAWIARSNYF